MWMCCAHNGLEREKQRKATPNNQQTKSQHSSFPDLRIGAILAWRKGGR
jgi:hypothetical protein